MVPFQKNITRQCYKIRSKYILKTTRIVNEMFPNRFTLKA